MNCELLYIDWNVSEIAFTLGSFSFRWYSLCWCVGLVAVYFLVHHIYRQQKISEQQFEPMFLYCFIGILAGARLGHCLFYEPGYYLARPMEMLLPINARGEFTGYAGLASHGGAIGLITALVVYARRQKLQLMRVFDIVSIVTPLCCFAIRVGNLMNSEIIGKPTDLPWGFVFHTREALLDGQLVPRHPGQLYEGLCYLSFFLFMWWLYNRKPQRLGDGFFFGLDLVLLFSARILMEYTKENQVAFEDGMLFNMGQLLSVPFLCIGIYYLVRAVRNDK